MAEQLVWSDLDPKFELNGSGDVRIVDNVDSVYASINTIIETIQGQRVMLRGFASRLKNLLFEPLIDNILRDQVSKEFSAIIERWDNRVTIQFIHVSHNSDRSSLEIIISFWIIGYSQVFKYSGVLNR